MTQEEAQIRACCVQAHILVSMTFSQCGVRMAGKTAEAAALIARRIAFDLVMADAYYAITSSELLSVPADVVEDVRRNVVRARGMSTKVPNVVSHSVH